MADTITEKENSQPEKKSVSAPEPPPSSSRRFIVIGVILVLVLGAAFFYWRSTFTEDTDDAQVDGNLYQVSSRITGHVIKVYVDDNQTVQAGEPLADVDPTDYQVALDQAEADLANAQAQYTQARTNVPITSITVGTNVSTSASDVRGSSDTVAQSEKQVEAATARVAQAQANAQKAQDDVDRYTPLVKNDVISKQQYDTAVQALAGAKASVIEAEANVLAQQNAVSNARSRLAQAQAQSAVDGSNDRTFLGAHILHVQENSPSPDRSLWLNPRFVPISHTGSRPAAQRALLRAALPTGVPYDSARAYGSQDEASRRSHPR